MSDPVTRLNAALEGRYAIERKLGEGGMATVYLADDLKHERKVALKVLKPELAAVVGAERFLAEIKTTANLQHPHILPLFDSGEADSFLFYVMPFVEGESLRDRIDREKQLPVEEAVEIGVKVAGALEAAHRSGVIHRDIKPANILLQNGEPLVADYGIALAVSQAGGTRLTETGLSVGTPHYMSPEQASGGRELDARSDVYALGAVMYEMLVGDPPHIGSTAQAVVAKILTQVPSPISGPRPLVPAHVEAAVAKALATMPADRFQGAEQFAAALDGRSPIGPPLVDGTWGTRTEPSTLVKVATRHRWLGWAIPVSMLALAGLAILAQLAPEGAPSLPTRFVIPVPDGIEVGFFDRHTFAVSPDGRVVVYGAEGQLFLKSFDEFEGAPIPGTEGGQTPFFSWDGEWIGFSYETEELKKVRVDGGPVLAITSGNGVLGASWGPDNQIVFADALGGGGLWRVSADGGNPVQITTVLDSAQETAHVSPQILPGGALLFTVLGPSGGASDSHIAIQEPGSGTHRIVQREGTAGVYVPTGHLLYALSDGIIMAVPFDLGEGRVTGSARPVLSEVPISAFGGRALLAISPTGMVTYAVGSSETSDLLVWVDRDGEELDRIRSPIHGAFVRIAPDGGRIALTRRETGNTNIVLFDSISAQPEGFTFEPREDESPVWSPDGLKVAYSSSGTGRVRYIFVARVDRSAQPVTLFTGPYHLHLTDWSRDGEWITYYDTNPGNLSDLWVIAADGASEPRAIATTAVNESDGAFSPDVQWLAYAVADGGASEIWVRSFPDLGGLRQVSNGGGTQPRWSRDGTELFYMSGSTLMSIPVSEENGSTVFREATPLFDNPTMFEYDVHPDGDRFLLRIENPDAKIRELRVVTNWFEELVELVGN